MFVIVNQVNPFMRWFFGLVDTFFVGIGDGKPLFCASLRFASIFSSRDEATLCIEKYNIKHVTVLEIFQP